MGRQERRAAWSLDNKRVAWVDYAKGFCIVMVVMMHSTLGVEKAAGATSWMDALIAFAKPFRMPDFFLISGLFLARVIDRDWRDYLDRKVVHFAYFYVLWVTIQFAFKAPGFARTSSAGRASPRNISLAFIEPFGTLWFIYLLPIFFVVTKAHARRCRWWLVWFVAALLADRAGQDRLDRDRRVLRPLRLFLFGLCARALRVRVRREGHRRSRREAVLLLLVWALFEAAHGLSRSLGAARHRPLPRLHRRARRGRACRRFSPRSDWARPLRYAGRNSIVVYLAFFLPMAATRVAAAQLRARSRSRRSSALDRDRLSA